MWEAINQYLQSLGPTIGLIVLTTAALAYLGTIFAKIKYSEEAVQAKVQDHVAKLYHASLDDIERLRNEVALLHIRIVTLSTDVSKFRIVLLDIKFALKRLERNHPELNGDLEAAINAVNEALEGTK